MKLNEILLDAKNYFPKFLELSKNSLKNINPINGDTGLYFWKHFHSSGGHKGSFAKGSYIDVYEKIIGCKENIAVYDKGDFINGKWIFKKR